MAWSAPAVIIDTIQPLHRIITLQACKSSGVWVAPAVCYNAPDMGTLSRLKGEWDRLPPGRWRAAVAIPVFVIALGLYVLTAAPGAIFGDPSEYQFIPAIWGIAHPPGYAFYTLAAGLWQRAVQVGSVAYRTNLFAAAAGAWTAAIAALMALELARATAARQARWAPLAAVIAGLGAAVAPDLWQHSIHANAHIFSVAITMTQLWVLVRWDAEQTRGWLLAWALLVGLGVTHHPMTVWGIPAYGLFILLRRPHILRDPITMVGGLIAGIVGLAPWLYFPLRSPHVSFGPTDMATWEGFLRHATAQGLRVNLFHFGLSDQPDRLQVFYSLLHLQYGWLLVGLLVLGCVRLLAARPRLGVLWVGFLVGHLAFTLNSVQDVMAYSLHAFVALGVLVGPGVLALIEGLGPRGGGVGKAILAAFALLVAARAAASAPLISLRDWRDADVFVANLHSLFDGQGESAALVSDWEHLTPFFYYTYVEGDVFAERDLRPVYVTGATPWVESVYGNLPLGPVYLTNYRRDVRELGFRLRPVENGLWRVLEPPAAEPVAPQVRLENVWVDDRVQVLGYDLGADSVVQGGAISLILYTRVSDPEAEILMPYGQLGEIVQRWSTDSRRLTPEWLPGEVIVERYDIYAPYDLAPGAYPLRLGYAQLTGERRDLVFTGGAATLDLGAVTVAGAPGAGQVARRASRSLANIGNEVALRSASARSGWALRQGDWDAPMPVRAGQVLGLDLHWEVLARPSSSYTVFIHVLDAQGQVRYGHDYTPLGGAFPSYLWFPKWLPGQRVVDPYRLALPETLEPGTYWLEVGMYEMGTIRRIPHLGRDGTMVGDRHILGALEVLP